jgi:hypothetical protein
MGRHTLLIPVVKGWSWDGSMPALPSALRSAPLLVTSAYEDDLKVVRTKNLILSQPPPLACAQRSDPWKIQLTDLHVLPGVGVLEEAH